MRKYEHNLAILFLCLHIGVEWPSEVAAALVEKRCNPTGSPLNYGALFRDGSKMGKTGKRFEIEQQEWEGNEAKRSQQKCDKLELTRLEQEEYESQVGDGAFLQDYIGLGLLDMAASNRSSHQLVVLSSRQWAGNGNGLSSDDIGSQQLTATNPVPQFFKKRIVHLDLKGAAPRAEFLFDLFPLFANMNLNAILMEYEDMFPYGGELAMLARKTAYDPSTIGQINELANSTGLELIPLVQTFGHMEFALKHPKFASLREDPRLPDTICPSNNQTIWLIRQMLSQIRSLHPAAVSIHIGCDEAYQIGQDEACKHRLRTSLHGSMERLKMEHISKIARIAREEFGFSQVYAWYDMFQRADVGLMAEYNLANLLTPVVWGYVRDVVRPGYFPNGLFQRYSQIFKEVVFASAFKGAISASQQFIDIEPYMENLRSYRKLYYLNEKSLEGRLSGIVLTGWQRYTHNLPLCELLPVGIPTLAKQTFYMGVWEKSDQDEKELDSKLKHFLKCPPDSVESPRTYKGRKFPNSIETQLSYCQFLGVDLYKELENVRFVVWKYRLAKQSGEKVDAREIENEYQELRKKIAQLLSKYYYEETVEEWMAQHKRLASF